MRPFAEAAARSAGLPSHQFSFLPAVCEALPLPDGSVDAVVATLVLCSVSDVERSLREILRVMKAGASTSTSTSMSTSYTDSKQQQRLQGARAAAELSRSPPLPASQLLFIEHVAAPEGSFLLASQRVLDPLQQLLADGCHLTRQPDTVMRGMVDRAGERGRGFSGVESGRVMVDGLSLIAPHAVGRAWKL